MYWVSASVLTTLVYWYIGKGFSKMRCRTVSFESMSHLKAGTVRVESSFGTTIHLSLTSGCTPFVKGNVEGEMLDCMSVCLRTPGNVSLHDVQITPGQFSQLPSQPLLTPGQFSQALSHLRLPPPPHVGTSSCDISESADSSISDFSIFANDSSMWDLMIPAFGTMILA